MSDSKDKERARQRAAEVFAVRSGQITAEEGARRLGVSRKTYYEWENLALQTMMATMEDNAPGRPKTPQDEEKQRLQDEVSDLQKKLFVANKTAEVRDMLHAYELRNAKKSGGASGQKKEAKEETITHLLAMIEQIRERTGKPYRAISNAVRLPYPSLLRWRMRRKKDMPLVRQPVSPKVRPPDCGRLKQDIAHLSHGQNRTQGTARCMRATRSLFRGGSFTGW
jgi:hypothetical protein